MARLRRQALFAFPTLLQQRKHRFGVNIENLLNEDYSSTGYGRTISDAGRLDGSNSQFLYYRRGVPRTLRVTYGIAF